MQVVVEKLIKFLFDTYHYFLGDSKLLLSLFAIANGTRDCILHRCSINFSPPTQTMHQMLFIFL